MTHHPHAHMIVPGGGIALDGTRWVHRRRGFFLPVRLLSRLFRRLFLSKLAEAYAGGRLQFFGHHAGLNERSAFAAFLAPLRKELVPSMPSRPLPGQRPRWPICRAVPTVSRSPTAG